MAYDAAKAHEYYVKYRKKGLKKGRKKGSSKAKTTNLVGLTTAGLNDVGKMEAAMIKENLKKEMNTALSKAKTNAEKEQIRREYQQKALDAINKLKSDSKYAAAKATKSSSAKSSSGKSTAKASTGKATTAKSSGSKSSSSTSSAATQASIKNIENMLNNLSEKISALPDEQKQQVKIEVNQIVKQLRSKLQLDWSKLSESLKGKD